MPPLKYQNYCSQAGMSIVLDVVLDVQYERAPSSREDIKPFCVDKCRIQLSCDLHIGEPCEGLIMRISDIDEEAKVPQAEIVKGTVVTTSGALTVIDLAGHVFTLDQASHELRYLRKAVNRGADGELIRLYRAAAACRP